MIPLKDENHSNSLPYVTVGIILINILVFIYELGLGSRMDDALYLFGAVPQKIMHPGHPIELITLLTALFFHADFFHLAGNMLFLWVFGNNIEDRMGWGKFILFYLFCGVLTGLSYCIITPDSGIPLVGASGAISAILGAYFLLYPLAKVTVLLPLLIYWRIIKVPAFWFLLFWVAIQFLSGISFRQGGISIREDDATAWIAHLLGFVFGALFMGIFLKSEESAD